MATALVAGCATTEQVRDVGKSGFLGDYSGLQPGGVGQAALRYINPRAQFGGYDKVLIDPVTLWMSEGSRVSEIPVEDRQMLVDYLPTALSDSLGHDYALVGGAAPGVMRLPRRCR